MAGSRSASPVRRATAPLLQPESISVPRASCSAAPRLVLLSTRSHTQGDRAPHEAMQGDGATRWRAPTLYGPAPKAVATACHRGPPEQKISLSVDVHQVLLSTNLGCQQMGKQHRRFGEPAQLLESQPCALYFYKLRKLIPRGPMRPRPLRAATAALSPRGLQVCGRALLPVNHVWLPFCT